MKDSLDKNSDAELNEMFAREVCTWHQGSPSRGEYHQYWHNAEGDVMALASSNLRFCQDANAVLPWLEKWGWKGTSGAKEGAAVCVIAGPGNNVVGIAPTFCRAAVIALLRAKRATS